MEVCFFGVRGSTPAPGPRHVRYGGHTSCVGISADGEMPRLILDAGTGLMRVDELYAGRPFDGTLLLGHLHWDHTHGMPFFSSGFVPGSRVRVLIPAQDDGDAEQVLSRAMSPPHFPIVPAQLGDSWSFGSIGEGTHDIEGLSVLAREIPHKGGRTFGYRVSDGSHTVAYLSDHCPLNLGPGPDGLGEYHESALALAAGADLLIHDSQYRALEFPDVTYLSHSAAEYAVALGREAGAGRVALFHHAPRRSDDEIDQILADVAASPTRYPAASRPAIIAAQEGLVVSLAAAAPER